MTKQFNMKFTRCDEETFDRVEEVIRFHKGPEMVAKLEHLFELGVPANGYTLFGNDSVYTYLDFALSVRNGDASEYLIRQNYEHMQQPSYSLARSIKDPRVAQTWLDVGHAFTREMAESASDFWFSAQNLGPEFLRSIVRLGADLNRPALYEEMMTPPIVQASMCLRTRVVQDLIDAGADPSARQDGGYCALHAAVQQNSSVRKASLDTPDNARKLAEIVQTITSAGGDIDMVDNFGHSALHLACKLGYANKAQVLISAGADHRLKDRHGKTPENLAKTDRRKDVIQMLAATRAKDAIMGVVAKAAAARPSTGT